MCCLISTDTGRRCFCHFTARLLTMFTMHVFILLFAILSLCCDELRWAGERFWLAFILYFISCVGLCSCRIIKTCIIYVSNPKLTTVYYLRLTAYFTTYWNLQICLFLYFNQARTLMYIFFQKKFSKGLESYAWTCKKMDEHAKLHQRLAENTYKFWAAHEGLMVSECR